LLSHSYFSCGRQVASDLEPDPSRLAGWPWHPIANGRDSVFVPFACQIMRRTVVAGGSYRSSGAVGLRSATAFGQVRDAGMMILKTARGASSSWVRIPRPPPLTCDDAFPGSVGGWGHEDPEGDSCHSRARWGRKFRAAPVR